MTAIAGTIQGLQMDLETARQHVTRIHEHIDRADYHLGQARQLIWELKEKEGWKVLGYSSWHKCVKDLFKQSSSSVYRQLDAALVELDLSPVGGIGSIKERVLRPLANRNFDAEARQAIWACANEIVGEGGKVTEGVINTVIEGFKDMLQSGATQDGDGNQHPITEPMQADLVARVRQIKLAHKDHIKHMDAKRDYILGGRAIQNTTVNATNGRLRVLVEFEMESSLEAEKLVEIGRLKKSIYISLWTED